MIRALLQGRKTQTRRPIEAPTARGSFVLSFNHGVPEFNFGPEDRKANGDLRWHRCRYGQPGDLLWVKETWSLPSIFDSCKPIDPQFGPHSRDVVRYAADGKRGSGKTRVSIHMARWASRLTLRITDVRVQRLQEISPDDCVAEGVDGAMCAQFIGKPPHQSGPAEYCGYAGLWESINGAGSWAANPWVLALTFEVIRANVDEVLARRDVA